MKRGRHGGHCWRTATASYSWVFTLGNVKLLKFYARRYAEQEGGR